MSAEVQFHVVFSGEVAAGRDVTEVRAQLVRLFGAPEKVDALFAGGRVLVKRYVGTADARRYQQALTGAGAVCELIPAEAAEPPGGIGKQTITYGTPAPRPRRITPVYGSPIFADDEAGLAHDPPRASLRQPPAAIAPIPAIPAGSPPAMPVNAPNRFSPPAKAIVAPGGPISPPPRPPAPAVATAAIPAAPSPPDPPARPELANERPPSPTDIPDLDLSAVPQGVAVSAALTGIAATRPMVTPPPVGPYTGSPFDSALFVSGSAEAPFPASDPESSESSPGMGDPNAIELETTPIAEGLVESVEAAAVDLALPQLVRDPSTGLVAAIAPDREEPPGRGAEAPQDRAGKPMLTPALGSQSGPTPGSSAPSPGELQTPAMLAAAVRARFGMTLIALAHFAGAVLAAAAALAALLTGHWLGFVAMAPFAVVSLVGGQRLWAALVAAEEATEDRSSAGILRSLEEQARFFRLWGYVQAVTIALAGLAVAAAIATGVGTRLLRGVPPGEPGPGEAEAKQATTVLGWSRRSMMEGFELQFEMGDDTQRTVRCTPDLSLGYLCECRIGDAEEGSFATRAEPTEVTAATDLAREGCKWDLVVSSRPVVSR